MKLTVDIFVECWDLSSLEEVDISGAVVKPYPAVLPDWSCKVERSQCHHHLTRRIFTAGATWKFPFRLGPVDLLSNATHHGSFPWDWRDSSTRSTVWISDGDRIALTISIIALEILMVWTLAWYLSNWNSWTTQPTFPKTFILFHTIYLCFDYIFCQQRAEPRVYCLAHLTCTHRWSSS